MNHQIPSEIIIDPDRPRLDAKAFLERLQATNRAFAALAEAIEEIGPPAAKELPAPSTEPCP